MGCMCIHSAAIMAINPATKKAVAVCIRIDITKADVQRCFVTCGLCELFVDFTSIEGALDIFLHFLSDMNHFRRLLTII